MQIKIEKENLVRVLHILNPIISAQATRPILQNIEVRAEDGALYFTASDTLITVRCSAEAEVSGKLRSSFNCRRLFNIVRELPQQHVDIEITEDHVATISSGASSYRLYGIPPDEFPDLHPVEEFFTHTMEQNLLKEAFKKTSYAVLNDETNEARKVLTGVLMSFKDRKMTTVATDSKRLALFENDMELPGDKLLDLILPIKTVTELARNLKDEGQLTMTASKTAAAFKFDNIIMTTKLIEGVYPNYRQVIPGSCEHRIVLERELFLSALKRVTLIDETVYSIRLTFSNNQLTLLLISKDVGEAQELVPVKYSGEDIAVSFNPQYMMEPLKMLTSDEVYFEVTDSFAPSVIKTDIPFLYVIMPLRTS